MTLFREEATRHRSSPPLESITIGAPRVARVAMWSGLGIVVALLALLIFVPYRQTIDTRGTVGLDTPPIVMTADRGGRVLELRVVDGNMVRKGDVIAVLSTDVSTLGGEARATIRRSIEDRMNALHAEALQRKEQLAKDETAAKAQVASSESKAAFVENQVRIQDERAQSAESLYDRLKGFAERGIVSKQQLLEQQDAALQARADLERLRGEQSDARAEAQKSRVTWQQMQARGSLEASAASRQLLELQATDADAATGQQVVLHAPYTGVVTTLRVQPGDTVGDRAPIATLIPSGARFNAYIWVDAGKVGLARIGQRVVVRYDSFPVLSFGTYEGTIVQLDGTPTAMPGQASSRSGYRATVKLAQQSVVKQAVRYPLRSGMPLTGSVVVAQTTLLLAFFGQD